jgi:hypothetical protein
MKKILFSLVFTSLACSCLHAQLSVTKLIGKNSDKSKLGYCIFAFYEFPLSQSQNKSIRLELMDLAFFPGKENNTVVNSPYGPAVTTLSWGYLSTKLGYKYIFSETKTGIYVEPSAGFVRVVEAGGSDEEKEYGDGLALAFETGYSLEVGQRGHVLNFGLKYENDRGGPSHTISSVGFRFSYTFNMFRKKEDY